jgi:ubiquinol-cytochrome c reductase cytochrome c1 subunit
MGTGVRQRRAQHLLRQNSGWERKNTMEILMKHRIRKLMTGLAAGVVLMTASTAWASGGPSIERQSWSFGGIMGHYDKDQLRRGYQVFRNVCSQCHSLKRIPFRALMQPGGLEYTKEEAEAIAAEVQVIDGPDDNGKMFKRPGKLFDKHPLVYANAKEAAAAQNGAVPPDLSNITKGRGAARNVAWFMEPPYWVYDIATVYQEQGADYVYAMLTSFDKYPEAKEHCNPQNDKADLHKWDEAANKCTFPLADGMNYNAAFPGNQLAMPNILVDGAVEFEKDKAPKDKAECDKVFDAKWNEAAKTCSMTAKTYARDVAAFLSWAGEPKLEARKSLGLKVLAYLLVLAVLLFLSKHTLWRNVKH